MPQPNLLYTGVKRGKRLVVLARPNLVVLGRQNKTIAIAVRNVSGPASLDEVARAAERQRCQAFT